MPAVRYQIREHKRMLGVDGSRIGQSIVDSIQPVSLPGTCQLPESRTHRYQ